MKTDGGLAHVRSLLKAIDAALVALRAELDAERGRRRTVEVQLQDALDAVGEFKARIVELEALNDELRELTSGGRKR